MRLAIRTPPERCGTAICPRNERGQLVRVPALQRFAAKCRFDPTTGCVLWIGGTTTGRGNSASYGSFWDDGRRHFAHRWAAANIHGLAIDGLQVGHCCKPAPNTLCVQHVRPETQLENLAEQMARGTGICAQTADTRQFWLFVSLGIESLEEPLAPPADNDEIPFHEPPAWFRPFMAKQEVVECPF